MHRTWRTKANAKSKSHSYATTILVSEITSVLSESANGRYCNVLLRYRDARYHEIPNNFPSVHPLAQTKKDSVRGASVEHQTPLDFTEYTFRSPKQYLTESRLYKRFARLSVLALLAQFFR